MYVYIYIYMYMCIYITFMLYNSYVKVIFFQLQLSECHMTCPYEEPLRSELLSGKFTVLVSPLLYFTYFFILFLFFQCQKCISIGSVHVFYNMVLLYCPCALGTSVIIVSNWSSKHQQLFIFYWQKMGTCWSSLLSNLLFKIQVTGICSDSSRCLEQF